MALLGVCYFEEVGLVASEHLYHAKLFSAAPNPHCNRRPHEPGHQQQGQAKQSFPKRLSPKLTHNFSYSLRVLFKMWFV